MRSRLVLLVLAGGLSVAGAVSAQDAAPDPEKIRAAADEFEAGRRAYKGRDYEEAAVHFENANLAAPNAEALRSAIKARKEAKQPARAATLAALAVKRYPKNKSLADYAQSILAEHEKDLTKVQVHCTPACSLAIDSRVVPINDATDAIVYVEPGKHTFVAGWSSNRTKTNDVTATAGSVSDVSFEAPPEPKKEAPAAAAPAATPAAAPVAAVGSNAPPAGAEQPQAHGGMSPTVFFVGAGVTVALAGVTVWSGLDTKSHPGPDAVKAQCVGQGESCSAYQDGLAKQKRTNILIGATGVVGLATAIIGAFATDWSGGDSAPKTATTGPTISPVVNVADGAVVGAVGTF